MKNEKGMLEKNTRFAIKKLSIGAAAVLVSTSMYLGMRSSNVLADTNDGTNTLITVKNNDSDSSEASSLNSNSKTDSSQNNKNSSAVTETPVAAPAQNNDQAESATSEVNTPVTSAPLYTTQGQVPVLDMNSMFTQEQLGQYGDNPQIDWVTKPDVTNIGNVTGTAKLTYEDMDADPTEDGTIPTKTATVNVPVLVRKAEQEVAANQVKNSLDVINSSNNSLVAHYEWVGDKAANDEDEGVSVPGRDDLESNFMSIIEKLGFELDDGSDFPEDLMTFGTTNKSATLFVHPTSTDPVITDDPYFDADGNSSIDNVNETPNPANYIGNLGTLPEGTKIEWDVAPTYDYTKDEDGNYVNLEPTNTNGPSIKVTIPGKDPITLGGDDLKNVATLPAYGDGTLLLNPNNTLDLGSNAEAPTDYVTNLDSFIKKYLEDNGEEVNADNIQDFKDSFKWTIAPNTQQAGYTFGVFKYNDNVGNLVLFKVKPNEVNKTKTITRTITFEGLPQDLIPKVDPQTVTFKQNGEQTYVDEPVEWKTDDNTWEEYTAPTITGYTPDQSKIAQKTVNVGDQDVTVTIKYTVNKETQQYQFVDKTNNQNVGKPIIVEGKFGEQAPVSLTIPDNYKLAEGQTLPTETPVLSEDNAVIKIYLDHKTEDVTDTDADAKSTVTETINVTTPDGKTTPIVKTVTFNRTATKDLVTGDVSYGAWSDNGTYTFPSYTAPEEPGYTPSQASVAAQTVKPGDKDLTFDITYTANSHTQVVNYVDKAGKIIGTYNVSGKTAEKVDTDIEKKVPEGYAIVEGQEIPTSVTFGANDPAAINVLVVKKETATDTPESVSNKVATVVIYQTEDGKVVKTDVKEQKPGDKVEFNVPDGYVPADKLPDITVTSDMKPITIIVFKETPDTPPAGPQPTKSTPSDPKPDQKPDTPTTPSVPDPVLPDTETTGTHAGNISTALIKSAPVKASGVDEDTAKVGATNNEKSQNTLPQTGSRSLAGILLGSVLLAASLALGFVNKKKRN